MARPKGTRSPDYDLKRAALLDEVGRHLVLVAPHRPSFRDLASACGVSLATLRHYFRSRDGLMSAYLHRFGAEGLPYLERLAVTDLSFEDSIVDATRFLLTGFTHADVGPQQAVALFEGLSEPATGAAYLGHILEPLITALAERLERHIATGEMRPANSRHVALQLISPLFLATVHQNQLGGRGAYPLDLDALGRETAEAISRAYRNRPGKA
jgi:AcrR family transcriptional regulator